MEAERIMLMESIKCSDVVTCPVSVTVIVEIFSGFNIGHFRISPEFLISGGI